MQSNEERVNRANTVAEELWKLGFFAAMENNGCVPQNEAQANALLEIGQVKRAECLQNVVDADTTLGQIKMASALEAGRGIEYSLPDQNVVDLATDLLQDPAIKQACADYGYMLHAEGLM